MKVATKKETLSEVKLADPLSSKKPIWWIKLTNWEFWPFSLFYFPIFIYYIYLAIRARAIFFFSTSNPGIEHSGMLGESKTRILTHFDDDHKPKTFLIESQASKEDVEEVLQTNDITYPFILKPDIGERGWMVKKISSEKQLSNYLESIQVPFLLQEYVHSPVEMGIFYCRMPDKEFGEVTSIVLKEMMTVIGDGVSDVRSLLNKNPRSIITLEEIENTSGEIFDYIPELDEEVEVVPIGNHCKGTTFLDGNELINDKINKSVDLVAKQHPEFYYGRFDIRCDSIRDLEQGRFKIFELNGSGAEPGHIYQPGYPLLKAYKELARHMKLMWKISRINHKRGFKYMTFGEGLDLIRFLRNYNKNK